MTPEQYEELMNFFDESDRQLEIINKRANDFADELTESLVNFTLEHYDYYKDHKDIILERMTDLASETATMVYEVLDMMIFYDQFKLPEGIDFTIPKQTTEEDYDKVLMELLRDFPGQDEFIREDHEEYKASEMSREAFTYGCHNCIKECISKHYPEVFEFPGDYIRYLNYSTFWEVDGYQDGFYVLCEELFPYEDPDLTEAISEEVHQQEQE